MLHLHALNSFFLECKCNLEGSKSFICDWETGQCDCKSEFIVGDKCEQSMDGYWNFPNSEGTQHILFIYFCYYRSYLNF